MQHIIYVHCEPLVARQEMVYAERQKVKVGDMLEVRTFTPSTLYAKAYQVKTSI